VGTEVHHGWWRGGEMARAFFGFVAAGVSISSFFASPSIFNASGDWGNMYVLAHPRNPGATLTTSGHGKFRGFDGVWRYTFTVTNTGPFGTFVDIDF
jgi:hypothetical protein